MSAPAQPRLSVPGVTLGRYPSGLARCARGRRLDVLGVARQLSKILANEPRWRGPYVAQTSWSCALRRCTWRSRRTAEGRSGGHGIGLCCSADDPTHQRHLTVLERTYSAREIDGLHDEALTPRGAGKPLVEGHDVQRGRQSLRGDDGGGKLKRVDSAKRVHSKEPAGGAS